MVRTSHLILLFLSSRKPEIGRLAGSPLGEGRERGRGNDYNPCWNEYLPLPPNREFDAKDKYSSRL